MDSGYLLSWNVFQAQFHWSSAMPQETYFSSVQRKAASEAKTRHSDTESAQEKEHVDNLADELSKKATAAFSAEIEAVAGSKEAGTNLNSSCTELPYTNRLAFKFGIWVHKSSLICYSISNLSFSFHADRIFILPTNLDERTVKLRG